MPKYLLRLRKTSCLWIDCNSAMSLGSSKASSKAKATWHPSPPWKSLMNALSLKGSPLSIGTGSQAWGSNVWFSLLSEPFCPACPVFYYFAHWVSSSSVGRGLITSNTSMPFCSLFLFGLTGSALGGKDGWGGGKRKLGLSWFPRCILSRLGVY